MEENVEEELKQYNYLQLEGNRDDNDDNDDDEDNGEDDDIDTELYVGIPI